MKNKTNRQFCYVDIRVLATIAPVMFFDSADVTTFGLQSEDTCATAKDTKRIAFSNPIDGSMSIEAQIAPFKFYALLSDGTVKSDAMYSEKKTITASTAGTLTLPAGAATGTVFVYAEGEFGGTAIAGSVTGTTFTATQSSDIVAQSAYEVGYIVNKSSGVQKIALNNKALPKDYFITMETVEKDEDGLLTPYKIVAYKAKPKRSLDLSFSSEGEPATFKMEFSLMEDKDGNVVDMVEITE